MVTVSLNACTDGGIAVNLSGHADYAEKGKDIVCGAISSLFFGTINGINSFTGSETMVFEKNYIGGRGSTTLIICKLDSSSDVLLKTMLLQMQGIAEQYPDNVNIGEGVEDFIKT